MSEIVPEKKKQNKTKRNVTTDYLYFKCGNLINPMRNTNINEEVTLGSLFSFGSLNFMFFHG